MSLFDLIEKRRAEAEAKAEQGQKEQKLWAADPHQYGPGKTHIVDHEDERKTYCGRWLKAIPGKYTPTGKATCLTCLNGTVSRVELRKQQALWGEKSEKYREEQAQKLEEKRAKYRQYLLTPEWRARRNAVMLRAKNI